MGVVVQRAGWCAKSLNAHMQGMVRFVAAVSTACLLLVSVGALAQAPLEKRGSCPTGYHTSGNYCTPSSAAALPALPKVGSCPSGYHSSGDYCLASSTGAKPAVIKSGSCPTGYYTSGGYCMKS